MKQQIRHFIRKMGFDIVRYSPDRTGQDPLNDMANFLQIEHPVVFDVGANIGQSIYRFRSRFPKCRIYSFEPSPITFATLKQEVSTLKNVHLWNCALGSASGQMTFFENSHSDMSSFLPPSDFGWGEVIRETLVDVRTIDQFCADEGIDRIDILKSDTQGFDLEVFKGAEETINSHKIGLIYFEIIFSDMYKHLPSFPEIYDFLIRKDFLFVSFYQFYYQGQLAGWTDALFIQKELYQDLHLAKKIA
jgi:FkbM family methyltransferase